MSKKIAIIDFGTNTFHLLIAEIENQKHKILLKKKVPVKLAEDGIEHISDLAFSRAMKAMVLFKKRIEHHSVNEIHALGTAAFRESNNKNLLVEKAKEYFGIDLQKISGEKEAELIYYGVRQAVKMNGDTCMIMDIGGGSVEFIIADENRIFWKKSFSIGAAILKKKFHHSDPISESEKKLLLKFLEKELELLSEAVRKFPVKKLIGASGAFDTVTEMIIHRFYEKDIEMRILHTATSFDIRKEYFLKIHQSLLNSTMKERLKNPAIVSYRADMIVVSSILIDFVIKKIQPKEIKLSAFALKEGVLWCVENGKKITNYTKDNQPA